MASLVHGAVGWSEHSFNLCTGPLSVKRQEPTPLHTPPAAALLLLPGTGGFPLLSLPSPLFREAIPSTKHRRFCEPER